MSSTTIGTRHPALSSTFFQWLAANPGLWMCVVWLPTFLAAPVVEILGFISSGERPSVLIPAIGFVLVLASAFAGAVLIGTSRVQRPVAHWYLAQACLVVLAGVAAAATSNFGWSTSFALPAIALGVFAHSRWTFPFILLVAAFGGTVAAIASADTVAGFSTALVVFLAGLGNFVVHRLVAVVTELARTRQELARAAVREERARFSRDLHDLLGHTLSVITVKAEATRRLAHTDPTAVEAHAADIESISRAALGEVRQAVSGYRDPGLAPELQRARLTLSAAGVAVTIDNLAGELDESLDAALGWVVREGTTNVVRHSTATRCDIRVSRSAGSVRLEITNDGVAATAITEGAGLSGLRERVAACGGTLDAAVERGEFTVTATVPATAGSGTP